MSSSCLIVDKMHSSIEPMLKEIGLVPDYRPDITPEEIERIIKNYFGVIIRSKIFVTKALLDKAPNLKFIARAGAGLDQIDLDEVNKRGIILFNAPEGNADSLAEHAIAILLCLFNKILIADSEVRKGIWNREGNRGYELKGKNLALIGYGHMGKAVAKKLKSFGCNILAYDKYLDNYTDEYARQTNMEEIYEISDIVSFHIPLTSETKNMVDLKYLSKFKKTFWLMNTSRGEILKLKDLVELLKSGKINGAALDVLENEKLNKLNPEEKLNFNFLVKSEKVVLTPHIGGWTHESYKRINEILIYKIKISNILEKL